MAGFERATPDNPALRPLDSAVEFLRHNADSAAPLYIAGAAPMSAVVYLLIDSVSAGRYSGLNELCLLLALATVWKWIFSAAAQGRMQARLLGAPGAPLAGRAAALVCIKLAASAMMLWGSIIAFPFIYGFILSGLAAPALLDRREGALDLAQWALKWTTDSMSQAMKIAGAVFILFVMAFLGLEMIQLLLIQIIMPSFLGMDPAELTITISSVSWNMAAAYILFLIFDFFWAAASVMLYHEIQSRRVGVDIGSRLSAMGG